MREITSRHWICLARSGNMVVKGPDGSFYVRRDEIREAIFQMTPFAVAGEDESEAVVKQVEVTLAQHPDWCYGNGYFGLVAEARERLRGDYIWIKTGVPEAA